MAGDTTITVVGNLTADPELRFTPSGAAVANFTVASTPIYDRQSGEWKDGEALFLRCNIWREAARERGREPDPRFARDRHRAPQTAFPRDQRGRERTVMEVEVDEIGPSLRYATAKVTRPRAAAVAAVVRRRRRGGSGRRRPSRRGPGGAVHRVGSFGGADEPLLITHAPPARLGTL